MPPPRFSRSGTREAFAAGGIDTVVGTRFAEQLVARGLRVRQNRVPCNGSVNCSAGPEDEVPVERLQVALQGVQRLDMAADFDFGGDTVWLRDVPFDADSGEVVLLPALAARHARAAAGGGDGRHARAGPLQLPPPVPWRNLRVHHPPPGPVFLQALPHEATHGNASAAGPGRGASLPHTPARAASRVVKGVTRASAPNSRCWVRPHLPGERRRISCRGKGVSCRG
jgi:hypothetical protein